MIARQAVEVRAVKGGEGFQPTKMAGLFECFGIE